MVWKDDLRVIDMDDHSMVLGRDFMVAVQAIPMMDQDILLILVINLKLFSELLFLFSPLLVLSSFSIDYIKKKV